MTKILLVEDDPTMLSLLKTLLQIEGFEVGILDGFDNIIGQFKSHKPDLILMDVHLEDHNGLEILKEARQDAALKSTTIIMSSGMDFGDQAMKGGATAFMLKPYMPDDLIAKIKEFI